MKQLPHPDKVYIAYDMYHYLRVVEKSNSSSSGYIKMSLVWDIVEEAKRKLRSLDYDSENVLRDMKDELIEMLMEGEK